MSSCTLFCDDMTKFLDENLLLFTFLTGKLRKNLFGTNKKFVYLNIITNFCPKLTSKNIVLTKWKGFKIIGGCLIAAKFNQNLPDSYSLCEITAIMQCACEKYFRMCVCDAHSCILLYTFCDIFKTFQGSRWLVGLFIYLVI